MEMTVRVTGSIELVSILQENYWSKCILLTTSVESTRTPSVFTSESNSSGLKSAGAVDSIYHDWFTAQRFSPNLLSSSKRFSSGDFATESLAFAATCTRALAAILQYTQSHN